MNRGKRLVGWSGALLFLAFEAATPGWAVVVQSRKGAVQTPAPAVAEGPRSAVTFGFGGKVGPNDEGFVPGFETYRLRFGPGDWEGTRIVITGAWGDKDPAHYWNWPDGPEVRASDARRDDQGWSFLYSLAPAHNDDWVVANFHYTLRDGRRGVAGAVIPYGGSPAIAQEAVAALGCDGRLGPGDEGFLPEFDTYRLRFGPGDWAGTRITRSMTWGEGSEPTDHWGWKDRAEDRTSEVRRDALGFYFLHSLKSAGHSRWMASIFRFERPDGRHGVAQSVHAHAGAPSPPKPFGAVAGSPVAPPAPAPKAPPTARTLASARPTPADLQYLKGLADRFRELGPEEFVTLDHLDLSGTAIDDAGMAHLRGLKSLHELSLRGTHVGDAGLANIAGLTGLRSLNLIDTPLTDAGLATVGRLTGLTELNIDRTQITDAGLRSLAKLAALEVLTLSTTDVGDAGLRSLKSLPSLRSINLAKDMAYIGERITGTGLAHLAKVAPKLKDWHISHLPIGDEDIAMLRGAGQIGLLDLTSTKVTDGVIPHLQTLKSLEELHLHATAITPQGLAGLKKLPRLKYLFLGFADLGDDGMAAIAPLTDLEVLSVTKANVTDAGMVHLRGMKMLDRLFLPDNKITGAGIANLRGLSEIYRLNLYYNQLDDASLAVLRTLPKLEHLYLSGDKITDKGLVHLKALSHLHYLNISWTKVTDAGLDDLRKALPHLRIDHADD